MISFIERYKNNTILKASFSIAIITILTKILGYVEKVLLAYYFGTSNEIDVYSVITTVIISVFVFFRELVEPGFLQVFLKALNLKDDKGAWAFFNRVALLIFIITLALSIVVFFYSEKIIDVLAPGFYGVKRCLTINLLKYAFPATIFLSLTSLTNITLNGQKEFALPASGDLVFKVVILIVVIVLFPHLGIYSLVYGLILGSIGKLIVHSLRLYEKYTLRQNEFNHRYSKDAWRLTWPLLIGVSFSQLSSIIDNIFASYMKEGAISALGYSKKIIELPILIFPYILSVVIFPYFSELSLAKEKDKLSNLLISSLAWIIIVFTPLCIFFNMFSYDLVEIIFQRGAFTSYSTELTAYPLSIYSYGLMFFALETIVVIFFFASANTKTPIIIGIICVCENIILTYLLINTIGYAGIALALVISKTTKVCVLLHQLHHKLHINFKQLSMFFIKVSFASSILPLVFYFHRIVLKLALSGGILHKILYLSSAFLLGTTIYVICLFLLKINKKLLFEFN